MDKSERSRLKYRNQYILAPNSIQFGFEHQTHSAGEGYMLYTHVDLPVTHVQEGEKQLFLLGDMFDYQNPAYGNKEIAKELMAHEFEKILEYSGKYSGRFVLIHMNEGEMRLLHDATATRKIYYYNKDGQTWFSSQPHLLARVLGLKKTTDPEKLDYYASKRFVRLHNSNIGNLTIYESVFQLLPNHYYHGTEGKALRYWPREAADPMSVREIAQKCAEMIRGIMESITNRYEVMIPVTAGKDSRTLLAATKGFSEKAYFYINKEHRLSNTDPDIEVPRKLLRHLGLDYHVVDPYVKIDEEFRNAYFENNPIASESFLPIINNYYCNYSSKVNLPGNIASAGYEVYKGRKMRISGYSLARLNGVESWKFASDYYQGWVDEVEELSRNTGISMLNLFYWEERLANWGTQIQLEKDIAQEDINPFNSRDLAGLYLSVPPRQIETPLFRFHHRVIRLLWPEVLKIPINHSRRNTILKVGKFMGILDLYFRLKYSRLNKY